MTDATTAEAIIVDITQGEIEQRSEPGCSWPTPNWGILRDQPDPPPYPVAYFGNATPWICEAARGNDLAPDFYAAWLLASVSALCGKIYSVEANRGWLEPINIWVLNLGNSSSGKSPSLAPFDKQLGIIQKRYQSEHEAEIDQQLMLLPDDSKEARQSLEEARKRPPRVLTNDVTPEALPPLEAVSPKGLMVLRDELSGSIQAMDGYSGISGRSYFLTAWSGGSSYTDRKGSDPISVSRHLFNMAGGIQPTTLRDLLIKGNADDGLASRFLIHWPNGIDVDRLPQGSDPSPLNRALDRLSKLSPPDSAEFHTLVPTHEAKNEYEPFYVRNKNEGKDLFGKFASAHGKMRGYVLRLSGALKLIDWAFSQSQYPPTLELEAEYMRGALGLMDGYYLPQCRRVYFTVDLPPGDRMAIDLIGLIRKYNIEQFTKYALKRGECLPDGITLPGARQSTTKFDHLQEALDLLVTDSFIRQMRTRTKEQRYEVNPRLL
ncbi:MAG: DUF3987 domain-containing protein [Pseudomonadota bacterium]